MKKILSAMLATGFIMGGIAPTYSQATEFKISGSAEFFAQANSNKGYAENPIDIPDIYQRLQVQLEAKVVEGLEAVVRVRFPHKSTWGDSDAFDVADMGINKAYVDWVIPSTEAKIRMGYNIRVLPRYQDAIGNPVFGHNTGVAGVDFSTPITDTVDLQAWWFNLKSVNGNNAARQDMFVLAAPIANDVFRITPWAAYAIAGDGLALGGSRNAVGAFAPTSFSPALSSSPSSVVLTDDMNVYWLGLTSRYSINDSLNVGIEGLFSQAFYNMEIPSNAGTYESSIGWLADIYATYKSDLGTSKVSFHYSSGDDADGKMGRFHSSNGNWNNPTALYGNRLNTTIVPFSTQTASGTSSFTLSQNMSFFNSKLGLRVAAAYVMGTNDANNVTSGAFSSSYLTTEDALLDVGATATYKIYRNLTYSLQGDYIIPFISDGWNNDALNAFRIGTGFACSF